MNHRSLESEFTQSSDSVLGKGDGRFVAREGEREEVAPRAVLVRELVPAVDVGRGAPGRPCHISPQHVHRDGPPREVRRIVGRRAVPRVLRRGAFEMLHFTAAHGQQRRQESC